MRASSVLQTSIFLVIIAACFSMDASFAFAASRRRITVRKYRTNYRVDSWDDGRDAPYRVTFWKFHLKSVYTFDVAGNIKTLTARDTLYTFDTDVGSRLLLLSYDDVIEYVDVDPSSYIDCSVCYVTWDTLCDKAIADVCYLHDNPLDDFDEDAIDSVRRFCSGFGAACEMSAADACEGECTDDTTSGPTSAPTSAPTGGIVGGLTYEPTAASTIDLADTLDYTPAPTSSLGGYSTSTPIEAMAPGI